MRIYCSILVAVSLAVPAIAAAEADRPSIADESWFIVRIGGIPVGSASERWFEHANEHVFQAQMNVRFTRMGTPLSMSVLTEEVCSQEGGFQRARMESSVSNLSAHATLDGDSLRYESSTAGAARWQVIAWDPRAVSEMVARGLVRAWLEGAAAETTLTLFDISDGSFRRQRLVRGAQASRVVAGVSRELVAVDEYDDESTTPSSTTWYETTGAREPMRTVVRQLGVEIEIERVLPAELEAIEIEPGFDIIRRSMVPCGGFPPVSHAREVSLVLDFPGQLPPESMDGPNQIELGRAANTVWLTLTRDTARRETMPEDRLGMFLRPDRFVQADAPAVRAVADSIRAATPGGGWPLARAIARWVDGHITRKGMEHGYASALDVLRTRAGDCTEHSLLTVALLRAAGIPARPVVGLAYGESERAFVGHMWVEAYAEYWRTLDALNLELDPIRIRVHAPLSSEGLGERDLMRAYGAVAGVAIRTVESRGR
jgi:transglutaminase-like putative cysteine protease